MIITIRADTEKTILIQLQVTMHLYQETIFNQFLGINWVQVNSFNSIPLSSNNIHRIFIHGSGEQPYMYFPIVFSYHPAEGLITCLFNLFMREA